MSWMRTSYLAWPLAIGVVVGALGWMTGHPVFAFVLWAILSAASAVYLGVQKRDAASDSRLVNEVKARQALRRSGPPRDR